MWLQEFVASSPVDESPTAATRPVPYVEVANVTPMVDPFATPVFQMCAFAAPLIVIELEPKRPRPRPEEGTPNAPVKMIGEVVSVV